MFFLQRTLWFWVRVCTVSYGCLLVEYGEMEIIGVGWVSKVVFHLGSSSVCVGIVMEGFFDCFGFSVDVVAAGVDDDDDGYTESLAFTPQQQNPETINKPSIFSPAKRADGKMGKIGWEVNMNINIHNNGISR